MPTPVLSVGAQNSLGYVVQSTLGTPVSVPSSAGNWAPQSANTLNYDVGQHLIMTGSGSRGAEQYGAPGSAKTQGDFTIPLFAQTGANLLAYFFGADSVTANSYWSGTTSAVSAGATSGTLTAGGGYNLTTGITGTSYITVDYGLAAQETIQLATLNTSTGAYTTATAFANAHSGGAAVYIGAIHTITPTTPRLLTLEDQWGTTVLSTGQSYQIKDCMLDQLDISSTKTEWSAKYTVMGGDASVSLSATTPAFATDIIPLAWPHVTAVTAPASVTAGEIDSWTLQCKNGTRQFYGAGQRTPTSIKGGVFQVSGHFNMLFDSSATATAYANYINSVRWTNALTIAPNQNQSIAFSFPTCRLTKAAKTYNLQELVLVACDWAEEKPMAMTCTVVNADSSAY